MAVIPIPAEIVTDRVTELGVRDLGKASIREIKKIVDLIELDSGVKFIRMEMGIPGLPALQVGVEAQIQALRDGAAAIYPDIQGIPSLKREIAQFVKLFLDVEADPEHCLPTVGSTMGGLAAFMVVNQRWPNPGTTLFIDPGFPVQKLQCRLLGQDYLSFDVYDHRGPKLREKLESCLKTGKVSSIIYSNPNNPSWICLTEEELRTIAELADRYNVIVIEDLAYFAMDFRRDCSEPGKPPFQPTVATYTDNYILLISTSKIFSYAGERLAMMVVSDKVWNLRCPDLMHRFGSDGLGHALLFGALYGLSAGTSHSAQYGAAAMLRAVNDGQVDFVEIVKEYGEKAKVMKRLFTENSFRIVYDRDLADPIADGFYFTLAYPGMGGGELFSELLHYGISAISLGITGSQHTEGLRACTSLVQREQFPELEERLKIFRADHNVKHSSTAVIA